MFSLTTPLLQHRAHQDQRLQHVIQITIVLQQLLVLYLGQVDFKAIVAPITLNTVLELDARRIQHV